MNRFITMKRTGKMEEQKGRVFSVLRLWSADRPPWLTVMAAVLGLVPVMTDAAPLPGSLDLSFGDDGVVLTLFDPPFGAAVHELVLLADGRILAIGSTSAGTPGIGLARYFSDGSLDTSFGDAGLSTLDGNVVFPGRGFYVEAGIFLSDGRIVVQGNIGNSGGPAFVRFDANGTLDTTFGIDGIVRTGLPGVILDLSIDGEGRWVGTGSRPGVIQTMRFLESGLLDPQFGNGGIVTIDITPQADQSNALVVRPDGKIIVTGSISQGGSDWDFAALRLLENGVLDSTFGEGGLVKVAFGPGSFDISFVSTVGPDGKILIGGHSNVIGSFGGFGIARLLENGDLDTSFGQSGTVAMNFSPAGDSLNDAGIAVDAEGRIVCGGYAFAIDHGLFLLAAWTADGELDTSFGNGGSVLTKPDETSRAFAMAVQTDGKILLGGLSGKIGHPHPPYAFAIVRYHGSSALIFSDGFESGDTSAWGQ